VSREWAVKYGIAGYAREVKDAAKLDRVGKIPGQIKAIKASGDNSTDIVISNADADEVRSASQNLKFLSECARCLCGRLVSLGFLNDKLLSFGSLEKLTFFLLHANG